MVSAAAQPTGQPSAPSRSAAPGAEVSIEPSPLTPLADLRSCSRPSSRKVQAAEHATGLCRFSRGPEAEIAPGRLADQRPDPLVRLGH